MKIQLLKYLFQILFITVSGYFVYMEIKEGAVVCESLLHYNVILSHFISPDHSRSWGRVIPCIIVLEYIGFKLSKFYSLIFCVPASLVFHKMRLGYLYSIRWFFAAFRDLKSAIFGLQSGFLTCICC